MRFNGESLNLRLVWADARHLTDMNQMGKQAKEAGTIYIRWGILTLSIRAYTQY